MKRISKILAMVITVILIVSTFSAAFTANAAEGADSIGQYDYKIQSTYDTVDWSTWKAYKAATHVHTVRSDGDIEINDMIEKYYELGYDAMALTDHGTVNYGWTKNQSRLAIFGYQYFVHGSMDELSESRYKEITTGTGVAKGAVAPRGYGMTEIPLGIEINGMSTSKCHINGYFADAAHGELGLSETWPRSAVKTNYDAGGITHINHVGEWADAKNDISIYNAKFISDMVSIYEDYSPNYEGYTGAIKGCIGQELVNTADSRTKNDRYLYDEMLKLLAPQGINVFGFCEDDSHEYSDCDRNAQYFMMPSNDIASKNIETSMKNGAFYASSKNSKNAYELGDGFNAVGEYPLISNIVTDNATSQIRITVKNANKARMVADGAIIETFETSTNETTVVFDLNDYENKINSYVRIYFTGAGGITYLQPFLLTKEESKISTVKFNTPSTDTAVKVYDAAGVLVSASNSEKIYVLAAGDYTYVASRPGYMTTDAIPFTVTQQDIDNGVKREIDITLEENTASVFTYFYVPETIYLNTSDSKSFKHYIDRENAVNGALRSNLSTNGNIFFSREGASDISISYEVIQGTALGGMSIGQTTSASSSLSTSITSGNMAAALSSNSSSIIKWTATYTADSKEFTSYAYTYVYAPLTGNSSTAAAGGYAETGKAAGWMHSTMHLTATVWLTGVHSVSGGTASYKYAPNGGAAVTEASGVGSLTEAGSGLGTASADSNGGSSNAAPQGGTGSLTIDISRHSNFNQIPNLSVGLDINAAVQCKEANSSCVQYVKFGETELFSVSGNAATTYSGQRLFASDNSNASKDIDVEIDKSKSSITIFGHAYGYKEKRNDSIDGTVTLSLTYVDKTALRQQYDNAIKYAYQSDWFNDSADYDNYIREIKDAGIILGNPTADPSEVAAAKNELDSALSEVDLKPASSTINYYYGEKLLDSEISDYIIGDTIVASFKEIDGYSYSNNWTCTVNGSVIKSGDETFGSIMATQTEYTWNFYYDALSYEVDFLTSDEDYSPIGGSGATAVYAEDYVLPSNEPEQEGYEFIGWHFNINNAQYAPGESIKWNYTQDGVFTAQWETKTYIAIYDTNGGEIVDSSSDEVAYGDIYDIKEEIPTKTGFAFAGWEAVTSQGENLGIFSPSGRLSWMYASNITFSAQWKTVQCTVSLDPNGGSLSTTSVVKNSGDTYGNLPTPIKTGYNFEGWYLDEAFTNAVTADTIISNAEDHTLYAKWAKGEYKVIYIVDNNIYASSTYNYEDTIVPLNNPTKTGHTFSGWSEIPSTMPANDVTVTGSFTANKYTITYILDGETYKSYEYTYAQSISPEAAPVKIGHTFSGWSSIPSTMPANDVTVTGSFSATEYTLTYYLDGQVYSTAKYTYAQAVSAIANPSKNGFVFSGWQGVPQTMPANDVSVYGTFSRQTYTIKYYVNGVLYYEEELAFGDKITPLEAPTKQGYSFTGWTAIPATMPARNLTINGLFTVNQYSYSFVLDNTLIPEYTIRANYGDAITAPIPNCPENYQFSGWSPEVPKTMGSESIIFYGTTQKVSSTISFDINGAVGTTPQTAVYSVGESVKLPDSTGFSKAGYIFKGWSEANDALNGITTLDVPEKDLTLYAAWLLISVSIVPADNSSTVVDDNDYLIYGVAENLTTEAFEADYVKLIGENGEIQYEKGLGFGTGTKVMAVDKSIDQTISTYSLVVYGDLDGDGIADGQDVVIATLLAEGILTAEDVGKAVFEAADCNHDNKVTLEDVDLIINSGLLTYSIIQVK